MSELTSSTEVDGACSVLSVDTVCNSQAENTAGPEPSISEHTDDNPDSITHDFVHVNIPINADADEITLETNQPSFIAGYLAPYAEYIPSLQSIQYVLPTWLFQATQNEGATSTSLDTNPEAESFETWVNETVTGDYTSSIEDEQRFRACLVRAMYENFVQLNRIDNSFMTENCMVTNEELCYARSSESQCTIRLLLMLLNRDTHTMLMFIYGMRTRYQDTVKSIFTSLNRHLNDSNFTYQSQCLRCNLSKRVNISLITDHLPQCSNGLLLLPFVNIVSEEDQPGQPTTSERLWNELFKVVNNPSLYQDVIITIARVIESSGYHTDIARMLQDDINLDRNSFVCRCEDIRICQSSLSQSSATDAELM
ncbi:uncharacterized protein LOC132752678 [Ruditapes philippinarum]|uniref:uncharacterized protein LOC132752678 n=1 Tax=Ruditapes philippinarum TaxID=129788 RepID=UPI00295A7C21|nr:uncharacterized protein LOC132752678 [Ruditapes philippinarum]